MKTGHLVATLGFITSLGFARSSDADIGVGIAGYEVDYVRLDEQESSCVAGCDQCVPETISSFSGVTACGPGYPCGFLGDCRACNGLCSRSLSFEKRDGGLSVPTWGIFFVHSPDDFDGNLEACRQRVLDVYCTAGVIPIHGAYKKFLDLEVDAIPGDGAESYADLGRDPLFMGEAATQEPLSGAFATAMQQRMGVLAKIVRDLGVPARRADPGTLEYYERALTICCWAWVNDWSPYGSITPTDIGFESDLPSQAARRQIREILVATCGDPLFGDCDAIPSDDDPAASVGGFDVADDETARFSVLDEYDTAGYVLRGVGDAGETLHEVDVPAGVGRRVVDLEGLEAPIWTLHEIEGNGDERLVDRVTPQPLVSPPPADPLDATRLRTRVDSLLTLHLQTWGHTEPSPAERVAVYARQSLTADLEAFYAAFWESPPWGYDVDVVPVEPFGSVVPFEDPIAFREALGDDIAARYAAGTRHFMLVGDANDHVAFAQSGERHDETWGVGEWPSIWAGQVAAGASPDGQPERDVIPMWLVPDTAPRGEGLAWVSPYFMSDAPYRPADDAVLTRLPVVTSEELLAWLYKELVVADRFLAVGNDSRPSRVTLLVGDRNHGDPDEHEWARQIGDDVETSLAAEEVVRLNERDFPATCDRTTALLTDWNYARPELVVIPAATLSNRYFPGNFMSTLDETCPFGVSLLEPYVLPPLFLQTCDVGDLARTEQTLEGTPGGTILSPVTEQMLLADPERGTVFAWGPTAGTVQSQTEILAPLVVGELFAGDRSRTIAEVGTAALAGYTAEHGADPLTARVASSIVMLGSPLTHFAFDEALTAGTPDGGVGPRRMRVAPNPFNPRVRIRVHVPADGRGRLTLFDAAGREVRSFVADGAHPGSNQFVWDGLDHAGRRVPSGRYFARWKTTSGSETETIVLIR